MVKMLRSAGFLPIRIQLHFHWLPEPLDFGGFHRVARKCGVLSQRSVCRRRDGRCIGVGSPYSSFRSRQYHATSFQWVRYICGVQDGNGVSCSPGVAVAEISEDCLLEYVGGGGGESEAESAEWWVVNFYHFVDIVDPHLEVARHTVFLQDRDVRGRIYISEQGINAQLSSRGTAAFDYAEWVKTDPRFSDVLVQTSPSPEGHAFPRLRLRYKPSLVQVDGGTKHLPITRPTERAVPLSPAQWKEKLKQAHLLKQELNSSTVENLKSDLEHPAKESSVGRQVVLLDVRNGYEWDVGHFKGAQRPDVECFKSTDFGLAGQEDAREDPLAGVAKEDADVMMYCTGGIRCDVYSTMLRSPELYNSGTSASPNLNVIDHEKSHASTSEDCFARCFICENNLISPRHRNCANLDCNQLFLSCDCCLPHFKGCCSEECSSATKLRPLISSQQYERWHKYRPPEPTPPRPAGYVSRRAMKRRRRKERRREAMLGGVCEEGGDQQLLNVYS